MEDFEIGGFPTQISPITSFPPTRSGRKHPCPRPYSFEPCYLPAVDCRLVGSTDVETALMEESDKGCDRHMYRELWKERSGALNQGR